MNHIRSFIFKSAWVVLVLGLLTACGSSSRPEPPPIGEFKVQQNIKQLWAFKFPSADQLNQGLVVVNERIALSSSSGAVAVVNALDGKALWQHSLGTKLLSGAGFDGEKLAVITAASEVVVLQSGKVQWRKRLTAQSYTNPVIAGARVFVLLADRSVVAFDAENGQPLWVQQRLGEPLVLKQNGVLMPFQNSLLAGLGGHLVSLNPDSGQVIWDVAIANPRGINDLERLVDLVASPSRISNSVCVRAFQAQIGCVDANRGALIWNKASVGTKGLDGDAEVLVSSESNGVVRAWLRSTGERVWDTDRLKYRDLTAPMWTPKGIVVGDEGGWMYVLSGKDGSLLNRLQTSAAGFASAPTPLGNGGFVMLSRNGQLTAYQLP